MPVLLALCAAGACSSSSPAVPSAQPSPATPTTVAVASITDGDTLRFAPPLGDATALRMLNIDAPEGTQPPWGDASKSALAQLAPPSTEIQIETDQTRLDAFGRLLGHAIRRDGVNLNVEQLRSGHAVLYVIWPNMSRFAEYRAAQIEAQRQQRGIWDPAHGLDELPFQHRLRLDRDPPFRPVGDFFTRYYVEAADYARVHVNNRVFFDSRTGAAAAGYQPCPRDGGVSYADVCFASGE